MLVVISILMIAMSYVSGIAFSVIAKTKAQTEMVSLHNLVRKTGVMAFSSGTPMHLRLHKDTVTVSVGDNVVKSASFEMLRFHQQLVRFNRSGMPNKLALNVLVRGKKTPLDLETIFNRNLVLGNG